MVLPHPSKLMSAVRFRYPAPSFVETRIANLLRGSALHETFRRCVPSMLGVWHLTYYKLVNVRKVGLKVSIL